MVVAASLALAACSEPPPVICGGKVRPENATAAELDLVSIAIDRSADLCGYGGESCDFDVYKTKAGQAVKATRRRPYDGRCISRIGDDRYYSFDASGRLNGVMDGI